MITICELQKLEAKIKYHVTLNKNQLCIALRIEPSPSDETFECYCRGKIKNNVKTILIKLQEKIIALYLKILKKIIERLKLVII